MVDFYFGEWLSKCQNLPHLIPSKIPCYTVFKVGLYVKNYVYSSLYYLKGGKECIIGYYDTTNDTHHLQECETEFCCNVTWKGIIKYTRFAIQYNYLCTYIYR